MAKTETKKRDKRLSPLRKLIRVYFLEDPTRTSAQGIAHFPEAPKQMVYSVRAGLAVKGLVDPGTGNGLKHKKGKAARKVGIKRKGRQPASPEAVAAEPDQLDDDVEVAASPALSPTAKLLYETQQRFKQAVGRYGVIQRANAEAHKTEIGHLQALIESLT